MLVNEKHARLENPGQGSFVSKKKAGTFVPALIGFGRVAESAPLNGNGNRGGPTGQNVRNGRNEDNTHHTDHSDPFAAANHGAETRENPAVLRRPGHGGIRNRVR